MNWRALLFLSLVLVLSGPRPAGVAAQELNTPPDLTTAQLRANDCAFLIQGDDDPRARLGDIACGTLDVPENWRDPAGRRIQIGYLVLKSTGTQPMLDPVVFLAGGPGSSPLTVAEIWARFFAGLRQERDVVFFDQRGTRLSSPLRCEGATGALAVVLPPPLAATDGAAAPVDPSALGDPDALLRQARARYGPIADACVQQLAATGVDLSQYTTVASANDVVALVKALGYDAYNLYGISYGTRLALEVMRNHRASGLRSVVLDSTTPPQVKVYEQVVVGSHEVAIQLFAACERDPACAAAYPNLKARFIALLARLRTEPVISDDGAPITDRDLINVMHNLTGTVEIVPYVPLLITELEQGEAETFLEITSGALAAPVPLAPGDQAANPVAATTGQRSPARRFVLALQASLSEPAAGRLPPELVELDTVAPDRQALRTFVDRVFAPPDRTEARTALLAAIETMSDADVREVFLVVEQAITLADFQTAGQTVPQYYSIECSGRIPFESFANTVKNAQQLEIPELALGMAEAVVKVFAICERWPSGPATATAAQPVWSEVPTLILAGAYDNLTPVSWNKTAFVTLPNGIFVLAPMSAHGAITYSPCAERIAQAFIANPLTPPDIACLADLEPRWVLPADDQASTATGRSR